MPTLSVVVIEIRYKGAESCLSRPSERRGAAPLRRELFRKDVLLLDVKDFAEQFPHALLGRPQRLLAGGCSAVFTAQPAAHAHLA